MPLLGAALWDALTTAGGSLALAFIVAIGLGILALTLLFAASAVLVLERFARAARRPLTGAVVYAVWTGGLLLLLFEAQREQSAALPPGFAESSPVELLLVAGLVVAFLQGVVFASLRLLRSTRIALASAGLLGLGYGLLVGGADRLLYAAAPLILVVALAAAFRWLRRRRGAAPFDAERLARALVLPLALGVVACLVLREPSLEVSSAGAFVLSSLFLALVLGLLPLALVGFWDMRGSAEWFIAVRYLVAKRRQTFISLITLICVCGVAAGVWLIITVLSVMNGFERLWQDEIIRNRAHFTVMSGEGSIRDYREVLERVRDVPEVVAAAPYLDADGMVRGTHGQIVGVRVRGVDPDLVGEVTDLREDLVAGSIEALEQGVADGDGQADPGILIGSGLADLLGVELGSEVILISPFGGPPTPFGPGPRLKRFRVAGVFRSTFFQYDEAFTYVTLPAAQDFRRSDDVAEGIEVRVTDHLRSKRVADGVDRMLGFPYFTRDWKELFPAFFQALKTEQVMMFLLLTMIMVVAAFVIVATLVMMIMEKSSDIAILKAMGARNAAVERIFAVEGALIGISGTGLGVIAGVAVTHQLAWIQEKIEALTGIDTLPASVYQFSTLPSKIEVPEVVAVVAIAMVLSLGATLLPSRQAAHLNPAEALRYE